MERGRMRESRVEWEPLSCPMFASPLPPSYEEGAKKVAPAAQI